MLLPKRILPTLLACIPSLFPSMKRHKNVLFCRKIIVRRTEMYCNKQNNIILQRLPKLVNISAAAVVQWTHCQLGCNNDLPNGQFTMQTLQFVSLLFKQIFVRSGYLFKIFRYLSFLTYIFSVICYIIIFNSNAKTYIVQGFICGGQMCLHQIYETYNWRNKY